MLFICLILLAVHNIKSVCHNLKAFFSDSESSRVNCHSLTFPSIKMKTEFFFLVKMNYPSLTEGN